MEFVTEVLRSTFGIVEPDATRLVLTTDREGFAVVGTYEREQAELLAETATRLARKHGFPLLVTVEEPGRTNPSAVARWLLRRRSARVATVPTSRPPQPVVRPEAWADFSEALACPCCGEESMRYRKLADGLVCTSCGRSFTQDG